VNRAAAVSVSAGLLTSVVGLLARLAGLPGAVCLLVLVTGLAVTGWWLWWFTGMYHLTSQGTAVASTRAAAVGLLRVVELTPTGPLADGLGRLTFCCWPKATTLPNGATVTVFRGRSGRLVALSDVGHAVALTPARVRGRRGLDVGGGRDLPR
jgi:hypothetical protein